MQCNIDVPFIQTRQNGQPFTIRGIRSCESSSTQYLNIAWLWLQFFLDFEDQLTRFFCINSY